MVNTRHTYEYVFLYFRERNCFLLSQEYINNHTLLDFICECKNIAKIRFSAFQQGGRCNKCRRKRAADKHRHTLSRGVTW